MPVATKSILPSLPVNIGLDLSFFGDLTQALEPNIVEQESVEYSLSYQYGGSNTNEIFYLTIRGNLKRCTYDYFRCRRNLLAGTEDCMRITYEEWIKLFLDLLPGGPGTHKICCKPCPCPPRLPC
jgi:hypothetical protein